MNDSRMNEHLAALQVMLEAVREGREVQIGALVRTQAEVTVALCEGLVKTMEGFLKKHEEYGRKLEEIRRLVELM